MRLLSRASEPASAATPDFVPYTEALTVLDIEEPELRSLLVAGRLRGFRDAAGKPLAVATLPMPPPLWVSGVRCPASYVNFLLANDVALVPVFDAPSDARALAILGELLPGREVLPIPARELVVGLGAVHCLTQQEPA